MKTPTILILANVVVVLGWINFSIFSQERILETGRPVFVKLAPADPRSLMQGDYMTLRYSLFAGSVLSITSKVPTRGFAVMKLDDRGVGEIVRFDGVTDEQLLAEDEVLIRYRKTRRGFRVAPQSYFFQEGRAEEFEKARFAEFRVSAGGEAVIAKLLDEELKPFN
ncbi:MAG: putative membrane-anchored protein [Verrucomicrobiales bacterium]|jgi:uncharacterized membrane-anchored protein